MVKKSLIPINLTGDLAAGLVVFLVALPLCLGIALASGAPLRSGIVAGAVGGIVIGFLSKSSLSVSGPAAGLTAIVLVAITQFGAFDMFLCAVIVAGLIQVLLGYVRAGVIADYLPTNVVEGMLAAIGIIIILKQIPLAVGFDPNHSSQVLHGQFDFGVPAGSTSTFLSDALGAITVGSTLITIVSLVVLVGWPRIPALRRLVYFPAPLAVVLLSVLMDHLLEMITPELGVGKRLVQLPVAHNAREFLADFVLPNFSGFLNPAVWITGATIAAVASVETMLSIEAVDRLDPLRRRTPTNHELKIQGIGNVVSGLLGGLPITSVIIRSSANVQAKARSRLSTITHGVLLVVGVALMPALINRVPLSALAAILLVTGYRLARPEVFIKMAREGWHQFVPFLVTIVAVVFTDLLKGVGLGLAFSVFFILLEDSKAPYFYRRQVSAGGGVIHIHLAQQVTFLNKASIKMTLEKLQSDTYVILDACDTVYLHHDVIEIIREFLEVQAPERHIKADTVGFSAQHHIVNTLEKQAADLVAGSNGKGMAVFEPRHEHSGLIDALAPAVLGKSPT
jgi:MFS superfamily sulfate permease-like transporter